MQIIDIAFKKKKKKKKQIFLAAQNTKQKPNK